MSFHRRCSAIGVMILDCRDDRGVFLDDARHAPGLGESEQAIAIDLGLDALHQRPDSGIASDCGDGCMKRLVGGVKCAAITGGVRLALTLENGAKSGHVASPGMHRCRARGHLLQCLAYDDRFRQRAQRDARDERA